MFSLAIVISVTFSFLASLMAYMITYIEYEKHKFPKKRLRKESLNAAIFTFSVWLIISLVSFYFIMVMVTKN
jgi:uncharacterized membrane protein